MPLISPPIFFFYFKVDTENKQEVLPTLVQRVLEKLSIHSCHSASILASSLRLLYFWYFEFVFTGITAMFSFLPLNISEN